jgi:hypothetical protein
VRQRCSQLGVPKDVLDRGPVPVPMLYPGRLGRGGDVEVGHDERVGVDGVGGGELSEGQAR